LIRKNNLYKSYMIIPALLIYCSLFIMPSIMGMFYSFTNWRLDSDILKFVGMENFKAIFNDEVFLTCIKNTFIFTILTVLGKNIFGFALALALNNSTKSKNILRTIFYTPCVLSTIVVGQIFVGMLHPDGMINDILRSMGMGVLALNWLSDRNVVMFSISAVTIWAFTGFHMAIYIAGLNSIPSEYYEASKIDGASPIQCLFRITLPLMASSINMNVLLSLIAGFKVFTEVLILTGGGPGFASEVVSTRIYQTFGSGNWGVGTALNTLLFIIISIISVPLLIKIRKQEVEI